MGYAYYIKDFSYLDLDAETKGIGLNPEVRARVILRVRVRLNVAAVARSPVKTPW